MNRRQKQVNNLYKDDEFYLKYYEQQTDENKDLYVKSKAEIEDFISRGEEPPAVLVNFVKLHEESLHFIKMKKALMDYEKAEKDLSDFYAKFGISLEQGDKMTKEERDEMIRMGPEKYKEMLECNKNKMREKRKEKRRMKVKKSAL